MKKLIWKVIGITTITVAFISLMIILYGCQKEEEIPILYCVDCQYIGSPNPHTGKIPNDIHFCDYDEWVVDYYMKIEIPAGYICEKTKTPQ